MQPSASSVMEHYCICLYSIETSSDPVAAPLCNEIPRNSNPLIPLSYNSFCIVDVLRVASKRYLYFVGPRFLSCSRMHINSVWPWLLRNDACPRYLNPRSPASWSSLCIVDGRVVANNLYWYCPDGNLSIVSISGFLDIMTIISSLSQKLVVFPERTDT